MADSLLEYVDENRDKLITPQDKFLQKIQEQNEVPGQVMQTAPRPEPKYEEGDPSYANVVTRMPGQLVETGRRVLGGATDFLGELARGQQRLFEIDDPSGAGAAFWKRSSELMEEQAALQGFAADEAAYAREIEQPMPDTKFGQILGEAGHSITAMLPALATAVATKNPQAALFVMGHQTALDTFQQKRAEGMDTETALQQAVVTGAAESVFEALPTAMIFKWFKAGKKGFAKHLKDYFKYVGAEIATEIPTTWTQNAADIYYSKVEEDPEAAAQAVKDYFSFKPVQVGDAVYQFTDDATHTAAVTALQSTILGGIGKGVSVPANRIAERREERKVEGEQQEVSSKLAAQIVKDRVDQEAAAREQVVFSEAEAAAISKGERTVEEVIAGRQSASLDDTATTLDEQKAAQETEGIFDAAEEEIDTLRNEQVAAEEILDQVAEEETPPSPTAKKVITNWATGEWEWVDDQAALKEEEKLDSHESSAAEGLKVDTAEFKTAARQIFTQVKDYVSFAAEMVKRFGEKVKQYTIRLWNAYKGSRFASEVGAVGDIEMAKQHEESKKLLKKVARQLDNDKVPVEDLETLEQIASYDGPLAPMMDAAEEARVLIDEIRAAMDEREVEQEQKITRRPIPVEPDFQGYQEELPPEAYEEVPPQYTETQEPPAQVKVEKIRDVDVSHVDEIKAKGTGERIHVAVRNGKIVWDEKEAHKAFASKRWSTPRVLFDGSKAQPFPKDFFKTFKEFKDYSIEHEKAHFEAPYLGKEKETRGQYEDRINKIALKAIGRSMPVGETPSKQTELFPKKKSRDEASEAAWMETDIDEVVDKARTEEDVETLFAAILEKNVQDYMKEGAFTQEAKNFQSAFEAYVREAEFKDEPLINYPSKVGRRAPALKSPEERAIAKQEERFKNLRTRDEARKHAKMSEKQYLEHERKLLEQIYRGLSKSAALVKTDTGVLPLTVRELNERDKNRNFVNEPRNIRDAIMQQLMLTAREFYLGDIMNEIYAEAGVRTPRLLTGVPDVIFEIQDFAKAEKEKLKEETETVETDVAEVSPEMMKTLKDDLAAKLSPGQIRANEKALATFIRSPHRVLAFIEERILDKMKTKDIPKAAMNKLIADFGVEFGIEEKKGQKITPITITPPVMESFIDWARDQREAYRKEDREIIDRLKKGLAVSPEGELTQKELAAKQAKEEQDVPAAIEKARRAGKGDEIVSDSVARDREIAAREQKSKIPRRSMSNAEKVALKGRTTLASIILNSTVRLIHGEKSAPITNKQKQTLRRMMRDAHYKQMLNMFKSSLDQETRNRNRAIIGMFPTFFSALHLQATQGRTGKANFLNLQDITLKMKDRADEFIQSNEYKQMTPDERKSHPLVIFRGMSIAERDKSVETMMKFVTPVTGTWEAAFWDEELEGDISFTAENVLAMAHIRSQENAETIGEEGGERVVVYRSDPSDTRSQSTPTINTKGYKTYDVTYEMNSQPQSMLAATENEIKDLEKKGAKNIERGPERNSNQGNLVGLRFYIIPKEGAGWARSSQNGYEVSTQGDKRFSAFNARLKDGRTIEEAYQLDIKGYRDQIPEGMERKDWWRLGKGKPSLLGQSMEEQYEQYKALWEQFFRENPNLLADIKRKSKGKILTDRFANTPINQARAISDIIGNLNFEFKDVEMTEVEFDRMQRTHDPSRHDPYVVLEKNLGTVENYGKGQIINGWDFFNDMENLVDAAADLISPRLYDSIDEKIQLAKKLEEMILYAKENKDKVSQKEFNNLPWEMWEFDTMIEDGVKTVAFGDIDSNEGMLRVLRSKVKKSLFEQMVTVKAALAQKMFKDSGIRNPEFFQWFANQYPQLGYSEVDFFRMYQEAGADRTRFQSIIDREIQRHNQAQEDSVRQLQNAAAKVSDKMPTQEELDELEAQGEAVRDARGIKVSEEGRRAILRNNILQRLPQRLRAAYQLIADKGKDINSLESARDRAVVDAFLQLETMIFQNRAERAATFLHDRKINPATQDVISEKTQLDDFEASLNVDTVGELRNPDAKKFYDAISKAFGIDIVVVSDANYRSKYIPKGKNGKPTAVINIQNHSSFHHIIGHEIFHHIWNRASDAQIETFKKAIRSMAYVPHNYDLFSLADGKGFDGLLAAAKKADPINGEEEFYAEIFAQIFRRKGFYEELSKTVDGQSLAAQILSRLLNLVRKVQGLFVKEGSFTYEGQLLFRNADMQEVYEIFVDLLGGPLRVAPETESRTARYEGILNKDGTLRHDEVRHFTTVGPASAREIKGYLDTPAKWLKGKTWDKIFKPGTRGWKDFLTNIEDMLIDIMDFIAKHKGNFWWVHWRAKPEAVNLASMPVHGATAAEQTAYFRVVQHYSEVFKDPRWNTRNLRKLHDDFVRGVKVITEEVNGETVERVITTGGINVGTKANPNQAGIRKARALGYGDDIIALFQEYKAVADEIHSQLEKIFPGFNKRESHYGQSLVWTRENGASFHDSFDSILEDEFSPFEGSKRYMKGKNTRMTTEGLAEAYQIKHRTINPHEVFLDYVREANKLIQLHKMMNEGQKMGLIKIFRNERERSNARFEGVEDPAFLLNRMNLGLGYKVKINEESYAHQDGQEMLFGTREEAQEFIDKIVDPQNNANIFAADIEEIKPDKRKTPFKYVIKMRSQRNQFFETNSFSSEKLAREWVEGRNGYDPEMEGVDWKIEPAYTEGQRQQYAVYGFHPDLAKLLNNSLAKDWLREGSLMGISGEQVMNLKNNFTAIEFAVSMFHFATITQEALASQTSWAARRYGKTGIFKGLINTHNDVQDIFLVLTSIIQKPELADDPHVKAKLNELFGTDNTNALDVIYQYFMAGGMTHMDPSLRPTSYRQGHMRYYKEAQSMQVTEEGIQFHGVHRGLGLVTNLSPKEMMKSVKEVFDKELSEEPNKYIRATFQSMKFGFLQGATAWLMETGIPKVKMAMWAREYTLQIDQKREQIERGEITKEAIARDAMLFIEDKFGEVNWKNNWMKPSLATSLKFLFRSFTWYTGSWKALTKAGIDITKWGWFNVLKGQFGSEQHYKLTDKGTWGITAVITHIMSVQLITLMYHLALATGDDDEVPDDPDTPLMTKMLFPRYDPSDPSARVTVPSYVTEGYKIMRHLGVIGDEPEVMKLISGRFNALLRNSYETFWTGTDWRGTQVRNPNDHLSKQALDSFLHMASVAPISISAAAGIMRQKGFMPEVALLGLAGLTDAPAAAKRTDAVNYGFHLSRGSHTTVQTEEEADQRSEIQRALSYAARGNKKPINDMLKNGIISKRQYDRLIKKVPRFGSKPNPTFVPEINRVISILTVPNTIKVIDLMTDRERKLTKRLIETKYRNMVKRKYHGQKYVDEQRKELLKRGYDV